VEGFEEVNGSAKRAGDEAFLLAADGSDGTEFVHGGFFGETKEAHGCFLGHIRTVIDREETNGLLLVCIGFDVEVTLLRLRIRLESIPLGLLTKLSIRLECTLSLHRPLLHALHRPLRAGSKLAVLHGPLLHALHRPLRAGSKLAVLHRPLLHPLHGSLLHPLHGHLSGNARTGNRSHISGLHGPLLHALNRLAVHRLPLPAHAIAGRGKCGCTAVHHHRPILAGKERDGLEDCLIPLGGFPDKDNGKDIHGYNKYIENCDEGLIAGHQAEIIEAVESDRTEKGHDQIAVASPGIAKRFGEPRTSVEIAHEYGEHEVSRNRSNRPEKNYACFIVTEEINDVLNTGKPHGGKGGIDDTIKLIVKLFFLPGVKEHEEEFEKLLGQSGTEESHTEGQCILVLDSAAVEIHLDIFSDGLFYDHDRDAAESTEDEKGDQHVNGFLFKGLGFVNVDQHDGHRNQGDRQKIGGFHECAPFGLTRYLSSSKLVFSDTVSNEHDYYFF